MKRYTLKLEVRITESDDFDQSKLGRRFSIGGPVDHALYLEGISYRSYELVNIEELKEE